MKAKDYFEEKKPNLRELWNLSDTQKEMMYSLMEKYAALRQTLVVGRSEQLVCPDCKLPFTKEELQIKEHCFNCGWEFAN